MININKLKHILNSCVMLPNYKALIVVSGFVKAKYIKNFIIENYGNNISDLYSIQENHVIFNNGSIIYVVFNNYPFLGLRVNELLYDETITQDVIKTIYEPMYIPYIYSKEKK